MVEVGDPDKGSTALGLLAHKLGCTVSGTHVAFQHHLPGKLPFTAKLLTEESFLFLMDLLDVGEQARLNPKIFWTIATFERPLLQMNCVNMCIH